MFKMKESNKIREEVQHEKQIKRNKINKIIKSIILLVLSILLTISLKGLSTNIRKIYTVKEYDKENNTLVLNDKDGGHKIIYDYPITLQDGVKVEIADKFNILNRHQNKFIKDIDISYEYFEGESKDIIKPTYDELTKLQGEGILVEQDLDGDGIYDALDYSVLSEVDYNNIYLEDGSKYSIESIDLTVSMEKETILDSIIRNVIVVILIFVGLNVLGIVIEIFSDLGKHFHI